MYEIIDKYIDKLIKGSTPEMPLWNIEAIRQGKKPAWNYIDGCFMTSILELYKHTKKEEYLNFVVKYVDAFVSEDGSILGYDPEKCSTDDICESRILFDLYDITKNEKYKKAIDLTYTQIGIQPRTFEGNFWHKKIYPNQVWLDGLFMAQVFYMRYETLENGCANYNDIRKQFENVRKNMYDAKKHLYYHGYDASRQMFWADKKTGLSKNFWLRSIGWYVVALADILGYMNEAIYEDYDFYKKLLKEAIDGLLEYQDKDSHMFYQVVDQGNREGNYLETSGSAMISYAILKGVRLNVLPERYQQIGLDIFNGICNKYVTEKDGDLNVGGICLVAGLGPDKNPRRDGTYEYYISEPIVENDAKGIGPLILAYSEVKKIID
ncbi:MAG: glycoside hydrolase family 88 protein [Acholeplasmatales bacterium]|nr:glycoside hydrolase family 88 protein [Acholeplasmatales bacterium]